MTDPEARLLGLRCLVVCEWRAGMLVLTGEETPAGANPRVVSVRDGCVTLAWEEGEREVKGEPMLRDDVPDLRDGPTRGAVLDVVRERWGTDPLELIYTPDADGDGGLKPACWWALAVGLASVPFAIPYADVYGVHERFIGGQTEAEALVAALEARPA